MLNVEQASKRSPEGRAPSPHAALDQAVDAVGSKSEKFARLPPAEKALLLKSTIPLLVEAAEGWAEAACKAKGLPLDELRSAEEWLAGPAVTVRYARLLARSLEEIAAHGRPPLGTNVKHWAGRTQIEVFPAGGFDPVLYRGLSCGALLLPGIDENSAREKQASFYQRARPDGRVSLVLGAGNVSSIPAADALQKMFIDGSVVVLKVNPVNEWVGPILERVFAPLISRDFLRIVYGGAEQGAYLCQHPGIDDIHITGSDKTHDSIVWGPPGPEQDRRRRDNDPVLKKTITSELGNVSPVVVVPGAYGENALWFQARNLATMIVNNASFNCNAAKMLVTSRAWPERARFFELLEKALGQARPRKAYYPGAERRYAELVGNRTAVKTIGTAGDGELPWTLITGLDPQSDDPLFRVEPFCAILSQTDLDESDPAAFLEAATRFCNERLWGTLSAMLIIDPKTEADLSVARALEQAILDLRYGTVAINHWPAVVFGAMSPPWGGHPSATLADVQSGIGWSHNSFMLEGVEKSIFRGPLVMSPKPGWFYDNKMMSTIARRLVSFEAAPSTFKLPGLAVASLRG